MKKIAIVNQRYGTEVNGGSEYYTRLLAEHLAVFYDVTVLTSTALDYDTWENYYPSGISRIHGVKVCRFPVECRRNMSIFRVIKKCTFILKKAGIHMDRQCVKAQGPVVPQLVRYIQKHKDDYDIFLFVTYLYYPTVMGMPAVAEKSLLIPTAHDEPFIHLPIYRNVFLQAAGILYLTPEEKQFVECKFQNSYLPHNVIGVGIDVPQKLLQSEISEAAVQKFRKKYQICGDYFIYAGRVDAGKNCKEMFSYFLRYKQEKPEIRFQLVIVGKAVMDIPKHKDIHYLGYISEEDKYAAMKGAKWMWLPSRFESLSIALLEGMALGTPGFVNGECEVLKGHCDRSGGAVYYMGYQEFRTKLHDLLTGYGNQVYMDMSRRARKYVEENYRWVDVEKRVCGMIENL